MTEDEYYDNLQDQRIADREWSDALSALHAPIYQAARRNVIFYPYLSVPQYADAGWEWVKHHQTRVLTAFRDEDVPRLIRAIGRYLEMAGRREKAARSGYRIEDEAFYPKTLIELALPALWDITLATEAPRSPDEGGDGYLPPKRISDPAEGNNWLATVVDVRNAYMETVLTHDQEMWLGQRYEMNWSTEHIAHRAETSVEVVDQQIDAALRKIQRTLGGERPTGCSSSCECGGRF